MKGIKKRALIQHACVVAIIAHALHVWSSLRVLDTLFMASPIQGFREARWATVHTCCNSPRFFEGVKMWGLDGTHTLKLTVETHTHTHTHLPHARP